MIIGLAGKARSGKDTVAEYLVRRYAFRTRAFASSLKYAAWEVFGWSVEHTDGDLKEDMDPYWGFSPRWALQHMGTEAMRNNVCQDVWIKSLYKHIRELPDLDWVISDVRFPDEAKAVKEWGGVLWRIERTNNPSIGCHASEVSLDDYEDWDEVITNYDGAKDALFENVDKLIEQYQDNGALRWRGRIQFERLTSE